MNETIELGLPIHSSVPGFKLLDHQQAQVTLEMIMGKRGALLAFIGGIWHQSSVRRIFWLQRHAYKFSMLETPVTLILRETISTLNGFHMSSPLPIPFPTLADEDGAVHHAYKMDRHPGVLLIDKHYILQEKWLMPTERVFPEVQEVLKTIQGIT
ncbi:MAG: hypothetical protein D6711_17835 [Chloroflexi bacterium]|nr:MAG: hypothetical protein D6711_17835 [Chloroflexota bacterium]